MTLPGILIGLVVLGILVFIHEGGHFLAARALGIEVEVFSLGMGPRIAGFTRKGTEYRISAVPLGGYCRMKGEKDFSNALEKGATHLDPSPGSYHAAAPWRRVVVALAGPLANLLLAVMGFTALAMAGSSYQSLPARIILYSEAGGPANQAADRAGLRTGDLVVSINGTPTENYQSLLENVSTHPRVEMTFRIDRDGTLMDIPVTPDLVKDSGAGRIGVLVWQDPVLADPEGSFLAPGFQAGDRIVAVNDVPVRNVEDLRTLEKTAPWEVEVLRKGTSVTVSLPVTPDAPVSLAFETFTYKVLPLSLFPALAGGVGETAGNLDLMFRTLGNLFAGMNPLAAVSGPLKISDMAGQTAFRAFSQGIPTGIEVMTRFIALISLALFFGNLLPIPALDGGQILLFLGEWIVRRPPSVRLIRNYQLVGAVLVLGLMAFAVFGDITYTLGQFFGH